MNGHAKHINIYSHGEARTHDHGPSLYLVWRSNQLSYGTWVLASPRLKIFKSSWLVSKTLQVTPIKFFPLSDLYLPGTTQNDPPAKVKSFYDFILIENIDIRRRLRYNLAAQSVVLGFLWNLQWAVGLNILVSIN